MSVADRHGERDDRRVEEEPREVELVEQPRRTCRSSARTAGTVGGLRRKSASGLIEPEDHPQERPDHEHEADDQDDVGSTRPARSRRSRPWPWLGRRPVAGPVRMRRSSAGLLMRPTGGTGTGGRRRTRRSRTGRRRSPMRSPGGRTANPCWYMYIVTDSVLSSGPPPVITNGSSNSWR